jgi:hypothetical protein
MKRDALADLLPLHRYKIADLLPRSWRQIMLEGEPYSATWPWVLPPEEGDPRCWPVPRNVTGYCPLGMLHLAGRVSYPPPAQHAPTPAQAAAVLAAALGQPEGRVLPAVIEFVTGWDSGEISDLAVALGLRVPA